MWRVSVDGASIAFTSSETGRHCCRCPALRLGVSVHTVERHVANVYRKIGVRGRVEAAAYALKIGLAQLYLPRKLLTE